MCKMVTKIPQFNQAENYSGWENMGDFCTGCLTISKNKPKHKRAMLPSPYLHGRESIHLAVGRLTISVIFKNFMKGD